MTWQVLSREEALQKLLSRSWTHPGNSGKIGMWWGIGESQEACAVWKVDLWLCMVSPIPLNSIIAYCFCSPWCMSSWSRDSGINNVPSPCNGVWSFLSWPSDQESSSAVRSGHPSPVLSYCWLLVSSRGNNNFLLCSSIFINYIGGNIYILLVHRL